MEAQDAVVLPHIRCVTCGKLIGNLYEPFKIGIEIEGKTPAKMFEELKLKRYCCRMTLMNPIVLPSGSSIKTESDIRSEFAETTYNTLSRGGIIGGRIELGYQPEEPERLRNLSEEDRQSVLNGTIRKYSAK